MIKIVDGRDTGKTRKLLEECGKVNGIFICKHPERIADKCLAYGLPLVEARGYDYYYACTRKPGENRALANAKYVYIDELEDYVTAITPYLAGYTLSVEENE